MLLPNVENAYIDDRKLIDYCISEIHSIGKHKARVFMSALNFSLENFQDLKESILSEILEQEAIITEKTHMELYML